jgi:hypothetical protein
MTELTASEMFDEMIKLGYVTPNTVDPSVMMVPTAYVYAPTTLAFFTPPMPASAIQGKSSDAKLGSRSKRNLQRKR